jgi:hypothetical protein
MPTAALTRVAALMFAVIWRADRFAGFLSAGFRATVLRVLALAVGRLLVVVLLIALLLIGFLLIGFRLIVLLLADFLFVVLLFVVFLRAGSALVRARFSADPIVLAAVLARLLRGRFDARVETRARDVDFGDVVMLTVRPDASSII